MSAFLMKSDVEVSEGSRYTCRLCLRGEAKLHMFSESSKIVSNIQTCCSLQISQNDGFPEHICMECFTQLEASSNFRTQCLESDRTLRTNAHAWQASDNLDAWQTNDKQTNILHIEGDWQHNNALEDTTHYSDCESDSKLAILVPKRAGRSKKVKKVRVKQVKTEKTKTESNVEDLPIKKHRQHDKESKLERDLRIGKVCAPRPTPRDESRLCTVCGQTFSKRSSYHSHMRGHHSKPHNCPECSKTFKNKQKLREHLVAHSAVKNVPCSVCGKMFKTQQYVTRHINNVHKRRLEVSCPLCHKTLNCTSTLKNHMKTHTGQTDFECDLCHRRFAFKTSLTIHIRTHTGERPYSCRYCFKRYADLRTLVDHELVHTGHTPYACPVCRKGFVQLSNMKSHFRYNHKGLDLADFPDYRKRKLKRLPALEAPS